ncbi:hypothetical protein AVEN_97424-1 [Araneus ventricosus]|uniref:Uncharacterized protein n=1 Tax=Araneus ventricosus TaxID=182803 RepID=A0A4Y2EMK2_ARAVE|nr:hypothetical protein AVEN_97424-1 [Araneus ventricosus]
MNQADTIFSGIYRRIHDPLILNSRPYHSVTAPPPSKKKLAVTMATSREVSEEDIVTLVNEKKNTIIIDSSSDMEEEQDEPGPSIADAKAAANILNNFFATENIDEHVVDLFKIVDEKIDELCIKSKTFQPKITPFLYAVD